MKLQRLNLTVLGHWYFKTFMNGFPPHVRYNLCCLIKNFYDAYKMYTVYPIIFHSHPITIKIYMSYYPLSMESKEKITHTYHLKFNFQLKPPHVISEAVMYSNVSSDITSIIGHTTVFL